MAIESTRLRAVSSKQLEDLLFWVDSLPFKIEIKGNPLRENGKWHLFFVLPESDSSLFKNMPLIIEL